LPTLYIDAEVELDEMDAPFIQNLPLLAPHGPANPRPLLSSRYDLTIEEAKAVGKESLKLRVRDERKAFEVIGFGMGELLESIPPKAKVAFSPSLEEWNGMKRLQLELRALKWEGG
ncbi:MAG: single-stranded-DNA-specific exonuclease RecJ, partial [Deltaproteobacteria bacterium]